MIQAISSKDRLVEQIIHFWKHYDPTTVHSISDIEAKEQIQVLLDKNRIISIMDERMKTLHGYVESWRINFEQFGRIICQLPFNVLAEDINGGNICYLANITIHPDHRNSSVIKMLKVKFFLQNYMCDFFVGEAKRKKTQPVKVFTRQEYYNKYMKRFEGLGAINHG